MKTELLDGETVTKEGPANLQRGIETVGGKLWLTERRLIFESHALNVQTGATVVELEDVQGVEGAWTKFLGFIPLVPNSVAVRVSGGQEFCYVVTGRDQWIDAIQAAAPNTA